MVGAKIATLDKGANQHTAIAASTQKEVAVQICTATQQARRGRN